MEKFSGSTVQQSMYTICWCGKSYENKLQRKETTEILLWNNTTNCYTEVYEEDTQVDYKS